MNDRSDFMVIVDKEIKELVDSKNLITNFNVDRLSSISYDVVIDKFIVDKKEVSDEEYVLSKNEYVYIKTYESLNMTDDLCCKVIEKNSLMRKGLKIDGPLYQPGHKTSVFVRVMNISREDIVLKRDMKIAQLVFLKLNDIPFSTYDRQVDARYNDENSFRN